MPRTKTANQPIKQSVAVEPVEAENPFQLDELVDLYAKPIAHEAVRQALPERVKHHINRLVTSNEQADKDELLQILQSAKLGICFSVFYAVLDYAREASTARLNGSEETDLPIASSNTSEAL